MTSITGRTTFPMLEDSKQPHISLPQNCLIAEIRKLNFKAIDRTFLEYFAYKASIKTNKFSDLYIKPRFYCIFCSCSARFARWEHQPILSIHWECSRNLSNLQKRTEDCFFNFWRTLVLFVDDAPVLDFWSRLPRVSRPG